MSTFEGADEANNHFARLRKMDIKAYEAKQRMIENKFGFEAAEPKPEEETTTGGPIMANTAAGRSDEEE